MIGRFNLFCRTVNDANKPVGIQKVLMVLFDMNRVKTYGNVGGGPVQLQRWVSPPNHWRNLKQTYTLKCGLKIRLFNQSSLIDRKGMWKDTHRCTIYGIWLCVISYDIYFTAMFYLSCALELRRKRDSRAHLLQLFVYTVCPKIL